MGVKTMTRKLFSIVLSAFALLLLMGAAAVPEEPSAALLPEEESAVSQEGTLETDADVSEEAGPSEEQTGDSPAQEGDTILEGETAQEGEPPAPESEESGEAGEPAEPEETGDSALLIDGIPAPPDIGQFRKDGVTYVALVPMAQLLDSTVQTGWDGSTLTLGNDQFWLTATVGNLYMVANERHIYIPGGVQIVENRLTVPLSAVTKALNASVGWDQASKTVLVTRGTEPLQSGETFYDQEALFWLSRIIYAESGNQPLEGKIAVGNVVMNRVNHPAYPDTVQGVLAQKNQFSPYRSGALADRTPNSSSILAAKLVLDGGEVELTKGALYFDSTNYSWAAKNKEYVATLGGHNFYR